MPMEPNAHHARTARCGARATAIVLVVLGAWGIAPAHAAHPSLTEDAGTQGAGHVELEIGAATARGPAGRISSLEPQLSVGVHDRVDAIVLPTFVAVDGADNRVHGLAATTTDIKWRFVELDALDFTIRAGVDWPTGSNTLGGGRSSLHALLVATWRVGDATLSFNAGLDRQSPAVGERRRIGRLAVGVVHPVHEALTVVGDLAVQSNDTVGRATTPGVASIGLIARITPAVNVDVGYRVALNDAARPHAVVAGATFRW
jgi:hypothetical protein